MSRFRVLRCYNARAVLVLAAFALTSVRPHPANAQFSTTLEPDTIPDAVTITQDIVVEGKVFTVRDVVRRAMRGERTKLGGHRDAIYKMTSHVAIVWNDKKTVETEVHSVYGDSTGYMRRVLLASQSEQFKKKDGAWVLDKTKEGNAADYRIRDYDFSRFTRVPLYLEDDEQFDFTLLDRVLEDDRVIFHVAFRPKSDFSPMPKGEIYIDSKGFRVIHEVYEINTNPMPMLIKGIRRISVQWTQLVGGEWVPKQMAAEMDIRKMPFGPNGVSFTMLWDDFRFDPGFDARLFGERKDDAPDLGGGPIAAAADTTTPAPPPKLLALLQQEDDALFSPEVRITNLSFIDSTSARYDSLGVEGLTDGGPPLFGNSWKLDFGPALSKWDYNRVEGLVAGGEVSFGQADRSTRLTAFGAYATAPEKFRYRATFRQTLPATHDKASLVATFRDYVEPFGSNRPPLNEVRAFVGGADEQDYVHRVGGAARVVITPVNELSLDVGFAVARERSSATDADFSLFGDMGKPNPRVDEGDDQALVAGVRLNAPGWLNVDLAQRVAGGSLGGDFRYHRTDMTIRAHGFPIGRQELDVTLKGVTTGDDPPLQQRADVGGLSTVRGYDRRTHVGNHSFAARLEYLVPYDLLAYTHIPLLDDSQIQFVPWGDAARVGEGDAQDWIRSAGIGLQRYLWPFEEAANLRLDFAFPFDNDAEDMVVYLWFTSLF